MTETRDRVALAAVVFAVLLAQVLLYPGIDTLVAALGAETALDASMWFLAAEFAAFVGCAGLWGVASDRAGRRTPFVAAGALGGAAGYALLAALPGVVSLSFGAVLAVRVLQGAATIGAFSLAMTTLMDLPGGHGRNMAAAGAAIGGQLYALGPLVPLWVASALLVTVAVLALSIGDYAPTDGDSLAAVLAGLRRTPALALPYAFGFLDRLTAGFFALVGTLYFRQTFGLDPAATGLVLGLTVALAGVGMVAVGVLGALMSPATMALVTDLAGASQRGVAMGGFNVFGSLGFLAGVLVGGSVAGAYGYPAAFLVAGGLEIAVALVTLPVFVRLSVARTATFAD
jgi:MFS family permease